VSDPERRNEAATKDVDTKRGAEVEAAPLLKTGRTKPLGGF
jgi:hypothetical protein